MSLGVVLTEHPSPAAGRAVLATIVLLTTTCAAAEGHGRLVPSLSTSESYDDNLFSSIEDPQSDFVLRVSPGLEAGYYTLRSAIVGRYTLSSESFRDHPSLSTVWARHDAGLDLDLASAGGLRFDARQSFIQTYTPSELTPLTGLDLGRMRAQRFVSAETLTQRLGARSDGALLYTFTQDQLADGPSGRSHEGSLMLGRTLGPRDRMSVSYGARRFEFEGEPSHDSQLALLGWDRELGARTRLRIQAGPRFGDGAVAPEATFDLRHRMRRGEVALTASETETRLIGYPRPVTAQSVALSLATQLARRFTLSVAPGFSRDSDVDVSANVYRVSGELACQLTRWLSASLLDQWSLQRGLLVAASGSDRISHNVVSVQLRARLPEPSRRLGPEPPAPERAAPGRAMPVPNVLEAPAEEPAP